MQSVLLVANALTRGVCHCEIRACPMRCASDMLVGAVCGMMGLRRRRRLEGPNGPADWSVGRSAAAAVASIHQIRDGNLPEIIALAAAARAALTCLRALP